MNALYCLRDLTRQREHQINTSACKIKGLSKNFIYFFKYKHKDNNVIIITFIFEILQSLLLTL